MVWIKKVLQYIEEHFTDSFFFFLFFFAVLVAVNFFHFFLSPKPSLSNSLFFLLSHFGQSLVTVSFLAIACDFAKNRFPKWLHTTLIISVFLYLFSLCVESLLVLLMDISFCEGISIAFGADLQNFLELLYLSDLGLGAWLTLLIIAVATPFIALAFYLFCKFLEKKRPLPIKRGFFLKTGFFSFGFLLCLDLAMTGKFSSEEIDSYKKMLPWKQILVKIQEKNLPLAHSLISKPPINRKDLSVNKLETTSLPNIYLVICESLREDFINNVTAPNLLGFKQSCSSSKTSRSGANCTHLSWFSLFHSKHPLYWSYNKTGMFKEGSLPLNLLQEAGYSIHVYSSAQLRFYHFDEVLFGKNHHLATTFKVFPHYDNISAAQADTAAWDAFLNDAFFHKPFGNVYVIFLDSTHFNYSWPSDYATPFQPCHQLSWLHRLSTNPSHLESIKNRYKNSIHFVDSLFKQLLDRLKEQNILEDSLIVFCGDHGEEFKEQGKLFHASNLNDFQTNTPIYMKLGSSKMHVDTLSHVDIFPSILDVIFDNQKLLEVFDGQSIFKPSRIKACLSFRYNASFAPFQFLVVTPEAKGLFGFSNKFRLFQSRKVRSLSKITQEEETILMKKIDEILCKE